MTTPAESSSLREAFQQWTNDVATYLRETKGTHRFQLASGRDSWVPVSDDARVYRRVQPSEDHWEPTATQAFQTLDSYASLLSVMQQTPEVLKYQDRHVATTVLSFPVEPRDIAFLALPPPDGSEAAPFDEAFKTVTDFLFKTELILDATFFLRGANFALDVIELEPGLEIRRASHRDIQLGLQYDLIPQFFPIESTVLLRNDQQFVMKRRLLSPLMVIDPTTGMPDDITNAASANDQQIQHDTQNLNACLSLLLSARVEITGMAISVAEDQPAYFRGAVQFRRFAMGFPSSSAMDFSTELCSELQRIWKITNRPEFNASRQVVFAVRRLALATRRIELEDRLIDLFVAAEALYLTDVGDPKDKGELRYRLALRAAVWFDGDPAGWTRRQVFKQIRDGYDARSAIIHGSAPDAKVLKVKGVPATLEEFLFACEDIIRAGLGKAVRQIGDQAQRFVVEWDNLILPEPPLGASEET